MTPAERAALIARRVDTPCGNWIATVSRDEVRWLCQQVGEANTFATPTGEWEAFVGHAEDCREDFSTNCDCEREAVVRSIREAFAEVARLRAQLATARTEALEVEEWRPYFSSDAYALLCSLVDDRLRALASAAPTTTEG